MVAIILAIGVKHAWDLPWWGMGSFCRGYLLGRRQERLVLSLGGIRFTFDRYGRRAHLMTDATATHHGVEASLGESRYHGHQHR